MNHIHIITLILIIQSTFSTPGDLDLTFGPNNNGISLTRIGRSNTLHQLVLGLGADFYSVGEVEIKTMNTGVGHFTANGILDPTFNYIGYQRLLVGTTTILSSVAVQPDGNVIAGGYALLDQTYFIVARFKTDGSLDTSFGGTGYVTTRIGAGASINSLSIQPNGKIVVGGCAIQDIPQFALARYNTDGSLDATFGNAGIVLTPIGLQSVINAIDLQTDGKIVATGYTATDTGEHFALVRYNTNGSLDTTFANKGIVNTIIGLFSHAHTLAIQTDGKIIAAGYSISTYLDEFALARYTIDGNLDTTFNGNGIVVTKPDYESRVNTIVIQTNGNIIVGGYNFGPLYTTFALARYTPSGALDTTFGTNGFVFTPIGKNAQIDSLILQPDGKIIAGGFSDNAIAIVRYLSS